MAELAKRYAENGSEESSKRGRLHRIADTTAEDRKPDLSDLCLIRLSELHPSLPVITTDVRDDFSVYRRGRREVIPLLHPPQM
jgi:hypothetical protein